MIRNTHKTNEFRRSSARSGFLNTVAVGLMIAATTAGCWSQPSDRKPAADEAQAKVESPSNPVTHESNNATVPSPDASLTDPKLDDAGSNPRTEAESLPSAAVPVKVPDGSWTTQRLIALTARGPLAIDFLMRVGEMDLETANKRAIEPIIQQLMEQLGETAPWSELLELPLVRSGWIGNLIAQEDQASQLISMYDKNQDLMVQPDELPEFLTRGLSRGPAFSLADAGLESDQGDFSTTFGILDRNQDNVLDQDELNDCGAALSQLDFNADAQISLEELSPPTASPRPARMSGPAMLRTQSMIHISAIDPNLNGNEEFERQLKRKANDVLEHYSFLGFVDREQWPAWTDQQWDSLDRNADGKLDKRELISVFTMTPLAKVAVSWPSADGTAVTSEATWYFESVSEEWTFDSHANSGLVRCDASNILINLDDALTGAAPQLLRTQLNQALGNSAIRQFLTQRLQLQPNAIDVANTDGDDTISDAEFQSVWQWLVARSAGRLQGRWRLSARPWFQLIDQDHNAVISEVELHGVPTAFAGWDRNQDGLIDNGEMPLVAQLTLSRQDNRLQLPAFSLPGDAPRDVMPDSDWFDAMDTNRDGSISRAEFLGKTDSFQHFDRNSDGFIARPEVY